MEIQILDNAAARYARLKPSQYHGPIYCVVPAKRGHLKPVGEWNYEEIIAKGRQITVKLNGVVIADANLDEAIASLGKEGKRVPRASGRHQATSAPPATAAGSSSATFASRR